MLQCSACLKIYWHATEGLTFAFNFKVATHKYFLLGSSALQSSHLETCCLWKWVLSTCMIFINIRQKVEHSGQSHCPQWKRSHHHIHLLAVFSNLHSSLLFSHLTRFTVKAGMQAELPTGPACVFMSFNVQSWVPFYSSVRGVRAGKTGSRTSMLPLSQWFLEWHLLSRLDSGC